MDVWQIRVQFFDSRICTDGVFSAFKSSKGAIFRLPRISNFHKNITFLFQSTEFFWNILNDVTWIYITRNSFSSLEG